MRVLIAGGVVGPLLFILVFLIEGVTRPGYDAWRQYVSSLATGDNGWMQIVNFFVCGALVLGFAVALVALGMRATGAALIVFGAALLVAGAFVADPALGYPPGAPPEHTSHGIVHGLAGLVTFVTNAIAAFITARTLHDRRWGRWLVVAGIVVLMSFVGATAASVLDEQGVVSNGLTGLWQRIGIVIGWVWISMLAYRYWRAPDHATFSTMTAVP